MPIAQNRNRYQEGTLDRVKRAKGPDAWVYRWREPSPDGKKRVQRKRVIGTVDKLKTLTEARKSVENLRLAVNAPASDPNCVTIEKTTVGQAWGHFVKEELSNPETDRSPSTILVYEDNFRLHILPKWKDVPLEDVTPVAVEKWLRSLRKLGPSTTAPEKREKLAPATKAKLRNQMSCVFRHAARNDLYHPREGVNPISLVRQGSKRVSEPDILTLAEIRSIIDAIEPPAIKLMVIVAATTALRRSEVRGLKWRDLDIAACWIKLTRGAVRGWTTKMKTEASRKGIPMLPELAEAFQIWRRETLYNQDNDWVFASPYTEGKRPYYGESAMSDHILPAVRESGCTKRVGWHTFRRSFACLMGDRDEDIKVVQELMRHSSSILTRDIYQQGAVAKKRLAITHSAEIFSA
jgi:integrase